MHECGHIIAGMFLGFKLKKIEILSVGISACFNINLDDYNKKIHNVSYLELKKIVIVVAGPIVNIILAFIFELFNISLFNVSSEILVYSNFLITCFNLIPIYPLDGGRLIKYLINIFKGKKESYKFTYILSNYCIIILTFITSIIILYLKNISILIVLMYLWWLVISENKKYKKKIKLYKLIENSK